MTSHCFTAIYAENMLPWVAVMILCSSLTKKSWSSLYSWHIQQSKNFFHVKSYQNHAHIHNNDVTYVKCQDMQQFLCYDDLQTWRELHIKVHFIQVSHLSHWDQEHSMCSVAYRMHHTSILIGFYDKRDHAIHSRSSTDVRYLLHCSNITNLKT